MSLLSLFKSYRQEAIPLQLFDDRILKQSTLLPYNPCLLDNLCQRFGSDKGYFSHNISSSSCSARPGHCYTAIYSRLFDHCREHISRVFEYGIGTTNESIPFNMTASGRPGASLRVWKSYFPNAHIYGADIDKGTLFDEERINTYHGDQLSGDSISDMWKLIGVKNFDLIIDDGCHTLEAGIKSFEHSFVNLRKPGGIYVIEDIGSLHDLRSYQKYFAKSGHRHDITLLRTSRIGYLHSAMIAIYA